MQDNLVTSTDIGVDNPQCDGSGMYYQLGTTITDIPAGAFTLANGTHTNTSNYNDVQYMWTAECSGTNCSAVNFCNAAGDVPACVGTIGPDHWLIKDMEARMSVGNTGDNYIVDAGSSATTSSEDASHIHFREDWIHGDWTSLTAGANAIAAGINLTDCIYCSVVDTQISEILRPGAECHGITANGTTYKIDHNWIEGCSMPLLSGGYGSAGPNIAGWVPYQDVELRRNRLTFPYGWLGQSPVTTNPNFGPFAVVRKNGLESKEGQRILVDGNIIENVDNSGSQNGVMFDSNVWNSSNGTAGVNYQATVTDWTFINNIARNSCDGFEIHSASPLGGITQPFQRGQISNNLLYNASVNNPGCSNADNTGINFESGLSRWQGTITETGTGEATFTAGCSVNQGGCIGQVGSISFSGGASCTNGTHALTFSGGTQISGGILPAATYTCALGAVTGTTVTNPGSGYTPGGAPTVTGNAGETFTAILNSSSTSPGMGFAQLDFIPGQPLSISQCNGVTQFNSPTITKGGFLFPAALGPSAIAGTNPASLVVSYPWSGVTSGTSDTTGYCMISNFAGGPQQLQFTHNTFISDTTHSLSSANEDSQNAGPNYQWEALLQNDIMLGGGWFNNPIGEGCNTVNWNFDSGSLTDDHLVWPTRNSTLYPSTCWYGNNPNFLVASPVMYFPAEPYCTGSTSTPYTGAGTGCMGFIGAMSTSSMPLALADYHQYELRSDSSFYAGGSADASDGTSQGANVPALDTAQTLNLFVCGTSCGSPGPYPDH